MLCTCENMPIQFRHLILLFYVYYVKVKVLHSDLMRKGNFVRLVLLKAVDFS